MNIFTHLKRTIFQPSRPRVLLITPSWSGNRCWNFADGWARALTQLGISYVWLRVGESEEALPAFYAEAQRINPDVVLVSCGDHHLSHTHDAEWKRDQWRKVHAPTLCFCNERVKNSPFPDSVEKTESALKLFDGFFYVDEFAADLFERSGKPQRWVSQFADDSLYRATYPLERRKGDIYFRAQLSNFGLQGVYDRRRRLIEAVRDDPLFSIHGELVSPRRFARSLAQQRIVLRAPSNCPGWVEAFWSAVAAGCIVLHHSLPPNEVRSRDLLSPSIHYVGYDADKPEQLREIAADVRKNWGDYARIAEAARAVFLESFTIRKFVQDALNFMAGVRKT